MKVRMLMVACVILAITLVQAAGAAAQAGANVSGRLLNSLSGEAVPGATVQIDELRRQTTTGPDGSFVFDNVMPGSYHLSVRSAGYSSRRTEVTVPGDTATPLDIRVDPELHFGEVVSVSAEARSQFDAFQPTSLLVGQDLTRQLDLSIGATLENQAGMAARSFGPTPARPVIRGLDGDRVLILQDGQRMGDLSSQSGDHAVTVNPASAQRIEVVRGPATLLYGANAIGGLVNVITDDIPTEAWEGTAGRFTADLGSAANRAAGAADVKIGNGTFVLRGGGGGGRSTDVDTPLGQVANSASRNGFGSLGLAWTGARGYVGGSYGYDDTKYGVPVVEGGTVRLTPRRHSFSLRGGGKGFTGAFDDFRATVAVRRYHHDELEGNEVGTAFTNNTTEAEAMGSHRAIGRLKGSLGGWVLDRTFDAQGVEALSPAVDERGLAAFLYEEVTWPHVTFQFGGRIDHSRFAPTGEPDRRFTNGSGSVGLLVRPAAADDRLTIAASLARAARHPALEELFFFGLHRGNFAIELGNPDLASERALGFDVSLRWRGNRTSGEITYFRNDIDDFIFRNLLDPEDFERREAEYEARFPDRTLVGHGHEPAAAAERAVPIVDYVGADALLQGVEAHTDVQITSRFVAEFGLDYVRGSLKASDLPLPRMPPLRARGGLRYQYNAFQTGAEIVGTAAQRRVSGAEEPTDGYALLKLHASYSFESGRTVSTFTARVDNATNELYRNHLSLIKHLVPEMGRNVKLVYSMTF